jgi:cell shape-determining protein MreC
MKKTSLAKRNALLSSRNVSWGVRALAFVFFVLLLRLLAPNFFWQVSTPVFQTANALATKSHTFFTSFSDAAKLADLNEKITSENAALAIENQTLLQKIANLGALLGAPAPQKEIPGILAGVVARPPMSPYDTLVLAVGLKGGVVLGMEAFGEGNVPVGIVSSVSNYFSRVTLFSAPGVSTAGWVGHANVPLTITGAGAGALLASVARAATVAVGDIVFVPGPGMLPIGSVIRVDSDPLSPGVTLRIKLVSNPFEISWVVVRATGVVPVTFATSTLP